MVTMDQRMAARERPLGFSVMRQQWAGLGFFHWPVDASLIASRLPSGLHVDTFDGSAWIGVVPFFMNRVRPSFLPPLPWLSWFLELNVRTYVFDENGRPGVWFFSLDCNQPLAVEIARRFFHLPYEHADMSSKFWAGRIDYECRRKSGSGTAKCDYPQAANPQPATPGSLEWFLVERYLLFSADRHGGLHCGQVHHEPYQIETITEAACSTLPLMWNGMAEPIDPPLSKLAAATVDVEIFPLRKMQSVRKSL